MKLLTLFFTVLLSTSAFPQLSANEEVVVVGRTNPLKINRWSTVSISHFERGDSIKLEYSLDSCQISVWCSAYAPDGRRKGEIRTINLAYKSEEEREYQSLFVQVWLDGMM